MARIAKKNNDNGGANLGFEAKLRATGDKLRGNVEPSGCEHGALGPIFLEDISDAFEAKRETLLSEGLSDPAVDQDDSAAENLLCVRKEVRWSYLKDTGHQPGIGKRIDEAMPAIAPEHPSLEGMLPKKYFPKLISGNSGLRDARRVV
jgi:type I restriction enzyme M protein